MATQRYISTSFWDDPWIVSLQAKEKYLYMYLLTNPLTNIAGVYQISLRRIAFDTSLTEQEVEEFMSIFERKGKAFFYNKEFIIIPNWPKHQKWQDKAKIEAGIVSVLKVLNPDLLGFLDSIGYTYPINKLSVPYAYKPNYSDLDPDLNSDPDKDTDPPAASVCDKQPEREEHQGAASALINQTIKYWNTKKELPECRYTSATLPTAEIRDIITKFDTFSQAEIYKAIDYLAEYWPQIPTEYRTSSFQRFMSRSLDFWLPSVKPWERYSQKEETRDAYKTFVPKEDPDCLPQDKGRKIFSDVMGKFRNPKNDTRDAFAEAAG